MFLIKHINEFLAGNKKYFFVILKFVFQLKAGLSPSKNFFVVLFIKSPLKLIKNAFYFILKALFVLKIFKFLS